MYSAGAEDHVCAAIVYADAFAAALARETGGALLTGDPEVRVLAKDGVCAIAWTS